MPDLTGQSSIGNTRNLLFGANDAGAGLATNRTLAQNVSEAVPSSAFGDALLKLLQQYQQFGASTQAAGEREQLSRLSQTPQDLIGASPTLQSSVRNAAAEAVEPTISGARDVLNTAKTLIVQHEKNLNMARDDARSVVKDALVMGGADSLKGLDPEELAKLEKLAGYPTGYISHLTKTMKERELALKASGVADQNKLEQEYRQIRIRALSNRSGGLGLQDAKVNQAIHLNAIFKQYQDPKTGEYTIPPTLYSELALGLANLLSPTGQIGIELVREIRQATLKGDLARVFTYLTGTPVTGSSQKVLQMMKDSIDRQGEISEDLRDQDLSFISGLAPTGLDPARKQKLETEGLNSYRSFNTSGNNRIQRNILGAQEAYQKYLQIKNKNR